MAWATVDDVTDALGLPVSDPDHLGRCVDAANAYAFRRRYAAGYIDDPDIAPGPDATMGTIVYAVALYRERGAVDSYASFETFTAGVIPQSTFGQVNRLLGVPKPAVDRPPTVDELSYARRRYQGVWR